MRFLMAFLLALAAGSECLAVEQGQDRIPAIQSTFLVIYRPGPHWPEGMPVSRLPLRDHGRYLLNLYKQGLMKSAGPFTDDSGGAMVLEVADPAQAERIVESDPAVADGFFIYELRPWKPVLWEQYLNTPSGERERR